MTLNYDAPRGASVSPRVAVLSIVCFWLVYFGVATVRSLMIDWGHQTEMLAARSLVAVGSMVATYIVYLAMRPLAGKSLTINVTAVALLSIPAAVAYSSINLMAFREVDRQIEAEKARASASGKYVINDRSAEQAREQARVAIDAARDAIRQAAEQAREAAEAKAEAQRELAQTNAEIQREIEEAQREANEDATEAAREAEQAKREVEQSKREALRESYRAQREAYREAYSTYRENLQEARQAAQEAKRQGINIDIESILANIPAPPAPPTPPAPAAPPSAAATKPSSVAAADLTPKAIVVPPIEPITIPTPVITEPTPGTVMIQVGRPADPHKEKELSVIGQIADQALNGYFFFAAWGALFLALTYAAAVRTAEREAASYRAAARDAELRALRYQVNPHFLFNTLNSLSTLILKDHRDEAERMILNLSTFFRTSLTADPTEDVVLSEEIRLQRLYLDIEAVRFPDRLIVEILIPPDLSNARVPCLILQPLVENAIKYGVSRARRPVTLTITAREDSHGLVLTVEDDGDPLGDDASLRGTGVGLKNVSDRLRARFGEEAACRYGPLPNGGFGVTIFMPLIRNGV